MTNDEAQELRVLVTEALFKVFGKVMAFVIVAQDDTGRVELATNAEQLDLVPDLLVEAAEMAKTPPHGTTRLS